ncbi:GDP-mannose 4,6-dehydratase [Campylobacter jejuni subsp. doylei]|uniref:GDP-mannose 4,6-dehydratase n=1 Tax=Campylobacter jejuni subsp. doylei TaxID=32021 RepID=A0A448J863_CAMJU|nr:GDP-mannose 4,6-dehydratase [Campylobacter jejuni subsp. doylei]
MAKLITFAPLLQEWEHIVAQDGSDVFFESTVAKQIALIEAGYQEPVIKVGNLSSIRTFQDCRDAIRAYYLLSLESEKGKVPCGEAFNIAGEEAFKLPEVIDILLNFSDMGGGY